MTAAPSPRPNRRPRYRLPAWHAPYPGRSNRPQRWGGSGSGWSPAWSGPEPALACIAINARPLNWVWVAPTSSSLRGRVLASH